MRCEVVIFLIVFMYINVKGGFNVIVLKPFTLSFYIMKMNSENNDVFSFFNISYNCIRRLGLIQLFKSISYAKELKNSFSKLFKNSIFTLLVEYEKKNGQHYLIFCNTS